MKSESTSLGIRVSVVGNQKAPAWRWFKGICLFLDGI